MGSRAAQLVKGNKENIEVLDPLDSIFTPSKTSHFTTIGVSTSTSLCSRSHTSFTVGEPDGTENFPDGTGSSPFEHRSMQIPTYCQHPSCSWKHSRVDHFLLSRKSTLTETGWSVNCPDDTEILPSELLPNIVPLATKSSQHHSSDC
jgi:hypothetical protein